MNRFPKVSILIPTYNREKIIVETLASAVNQTYENIEVIVVDNKSTDNSYRKIQNFAKLYPNVKVYQNKTNLGPVRNWRNCMEHATGEYAKILWSDDLIAPNFIEKTLPWLMCNKSIAFVCTGTQYFDDTFGQKNNYFQSDGIFSTSEFIEKVLFGQKISVSASHALFRLNDLRKNTLIEIPNKFGSDFGMHGIGSDDLMFLLTAKDYKNFAFVNETLSFYRKHDNSISISTPSSKLLILHVLARAYFVENYVANSNLEKKFNTVLLYYILFGRARKSKIGIKTVSDFYFNKKQIKIDCIFFVAFFFKKFLKYIRMVFPKKRE